MSDCIGLNFREPVPYAEALRIQEIIHQARREDKAPDTLLFLEHPPTVTLGNRGRTEALVSDSDRLSAAGIELHHASRGGDVTYHAPGQLVLYPILKLGSREADAHGYLFNLEQIAIDTCGSFGVDAWRREGKNGAWTEPGKISAIGFRIKRWVTMHGLSFNVDLDLAGFNHIIPCGLHGEPVARLADQVESPVAVEDVRSVMTNHAERILQRPLKQMEYHQGLECALQHETLKDVGEI